MILFSVLILLFISQSDSSSDRLVEVFKWKQIEFANPNYQSPDFLFPEPLNGEDLEPLDYVAYNNVPMGVSHYNGILFLTLPRRRPGIPATLNYVLTKYSSAIKSPKFLGYPSYATNSLHPSLHPDSDRIVSVYRTRVDYACDRLWFVDTGMLEYPNNRTQVQRPSIWVIDLKNNRRFRRFEIPESIVPTGQGLPEITVDVDKSACHNAYAYIPDLLHNSLYVYSLNEDRMWRFKHNYFSFDPLWGDLTIANQRFQWNDGIFSITLGNPNHDGYRTAYFHPMVSTSEFTVSTKILRNETLASRSYHESDFQLIGNRGPRSQSTMHGFDAQTGIIFFAEISKSGVTCWNTNNPLKPENVGLIQQNDRSMIYPSDLTIDSDGTVWVMTNSMPLFIYSQLNPRAYNFRVWKQNIQTAVQNTVCAP